MGEENLVLGLLKSKTTVKMNAACIESFGQKNRRKKIFGQIILERNIFFRNFLQKHPIKQRAKKITESRPTKIYF